MTIQFTEVSFIISIKNCKCVKSCLICEEHKRRISAKIYAVYGSRYAEMQI